MGSSGRLACKLAVLIVASWVSLAVADEAATPTAPEPGKSSDPKAGSEDFSALDLEVLVNTPITVASRAEESVADASSSVTVFTQDELRRMGIRRLDELMNYVPGLQIFQDTALVPGSINATARGVPSTSGERILMLVDGQRVNDLYTGGPIFALRNFPVENVRQVEVIRGPGSALYGSNAFQAVISVKTLTGVTRGIVELGTENSRRAAVSVSGSANELHADMFAHFYSDDGYSFRNIPDNTATPRDTRDPRQEFSGQLRLSYRKCTLTVRHVEGESQDFFLFGSVSNYRTHDRSGFTQASANYEFGNADRIEGDVSLNYVRQFTEGIAVVIPQGAFGPGSEPRLAGPSYVTGSGGPAANVRWKLLPENTLSAGTFFEASGYQKARSLASYDPLDPSVALPDVTAFGDSAHNFTDSHAHRYVTGFYVQDKHTAGPVAVVAGVRYDHYNEFGSAWSPRVSVMVTTPFDSRIKASYARAFRAPSFLEFYDKNNPVDSGNRSLNPETSDNFELSYVQSMGRFYGSVTGFIVRMKDNIVLGPPIAGPENPFGASTFINQGKLLNRGLEFELRCKIVEGLDGYGSYTSLFAESAGGIDSQVIEDFGSFGLNYLKSGFNLNVNGIARGKMQTLPGQGNTLLLNARAEYELFKGFRINATVKNVLNREWRSVSPSLPGTGIPNRGATAFGGVSYEI